jgi:hypothetical protein
MVSALDPAANRLIVGVYLHEDQGDRSLPEPLAGHVFVAVVAAGRARAWGFSPEDFGRYDPVRDLEMLEAGVPGAVHEDRNSLAKRGLRLGAFRVSEAAALAAASRVQGYLRAPPRFSLRRRQCSTFAFDVLRAGGVSTPAETVITPRRLHEFLSGAKKAPTP